MERQQGKSGSNLLKETTVLNVIYWASRSWKDVEVSIVKCFFYCGFTCSDKETAIPESDVECVDNDNEEEADNYPIALHVLAQTLFGCKFQELLNIDREFKTCDTESLDRDKPGSELLKEVSNDDSDDESSEEVIETENVCSLSECLSMINKLKCHASFIGNTGLFGNFIDAEEIRTSSNLVKVTKQKKVSDFFTKQSVKNVNVDAARTNEQMIDP